MEMGKLCKYSMKANARQQNYKQPSRKSKDIRLGMQIRKMKNEKISAHWSDKIKKKIPK